MTNNDLLFLDTETDSLWKVGHNEFHPEQPRPVQIAFARYTASGREIYASSLVVRPLETWPALTRESIAIHGITEAIRQDGLYATHAAELLRDVMLRTENLVTVGGHNVGFDLLVLRGFFFDLGMPSVADLLLELKNVDTMQMGVDFCKLPRRDGEPGNKRPSLTELYNFLFGEGFEGAHDALADVRASARCYFELKRRGVTDEIAVPPRTSGARDIDEVRRILGLAELAPKRSNAEFDLVRDYTARLDKYGNRFLASDKVWSWLNEIANRA